MPHDKRNSTSPVHSSTSPKHTDTIRHAVAVPSPHVEAQRKREVEWLKMEEESNCCSKERCQRSEKVDCLPTPNKLEEAREGFDIPREAISGIANQAKHLKNTGALNCQGVPRVIDLERPRECSFALYEASGALLTPPHLSVFDQSAPTHATRGKNTFTTICRSAHYGFHSQSHIYPLKVVRLSHHR